MCLGLISREFLFRGAGGQDFFRLFRRELADLTRAPVCRLFAEA
jgi:hypothetical protein